MHKTCFQEKDTALMVSIREKHTSIMELLVLEGANINLMNSEGSTALTEALAIGNKDAVRFLTLHGANWMVTRGDKRLDVFAYRQLPKFKYPDNPVYAGFSGGYVKLNCNPYLSLVTFWHASPLHRFAHDFSLQQKTICREHETVFDVNVRNASSWTPLHVASFLNNTEAVKYLLDRDADVFATTLFGETAFHFAAMRGHVQVITLLFAHVMHANLTL